MRLRVDIEPHADCCGASHLRLSLLECQHSIFALVPIHYGKKSCHAAPAAVAALGDTPARALDLFGHMPEAYRRRRRAGNCTH